MALQCPERKENVLKKPISSLYNLIRSVEERRSGGAVGKAAYVSFKYTDSCEQYIYTNNTSCRFIMYIHVMVCVRRGEAGATLAIFGRGTVNKGEA